MKVRMLEVDLSSGKIEKKELDDSYFRNWIGGRGLGAKLLSEEKIEEIEPLAENNVVFFVTSPLIGYAPAFNRVWITTISPLTNYYLCSSAGGYFAGELRKAGFDVLKITEKSENPVYLSIENGEAKLEDASELWKKDTDMVDKILKEKHGGRNACIGIAGENLVRFACVQFGMRSAGRGGAGAVLGSKKLKAISVKGNLEIPAANKEEAIEFDAELTKKVASEQMGWKEKGTLELMEEINEADIWPTANWRKSHFDKGEKVYFPAFEKHVIRHETCFKCPIACWRIMKSKHMENEYDGPEYETIWAFGPQCSNDDIDIIIAANYLCDKYGMDTIATGSAIGFFMECAEKGMVDYTFQTKEQILELIGDIARRDGEDQKLLGEGIHVFAKRIGPEAEKFAIHQQGMPLPAYDPRGVWGMLLTYTLGPRHGCHLKAWTISKELKMSVDDRTSTEGKAELVSNTMDYRQTFVDSASHCSFVNFEKQEVGKALKLVVGDDFTVEELEEHGKKIVDLERKLDKRRGLTKDDDILPYRIIEEETEVKGKKVVVGKEAFNRLKEEFYRIRGW